MDWRLSRSHHSSPAAAAGGSRVGAVDAPDSPEPGNLFSLLSFELKRYVRGESKISSDVEGKIVNRCVLAALEVLAREEANVSLAGTATRPVVQARFDGDDSALRAARAAMAVLDAVRRVQRSRENEFRVVGSLASGTSRNQNGVVRESGSTERLLQKLRDRAAPGQILLSAEARAGCGSDVEAVPAGGSGAGADAYVLLGAR